MNFLQQVDNTNFSVSIANNINEVNNSNLPLIPLNFVHIPTLTNVASINEHHQQHFLSTSQSQQAHLSQSQQISISSEQQTQKTFKKPENTNDFSHVAIQQSSLETNENQQNEIILQQSSSLHYINEFNHLNQQRNLSSNKNNNLFNYYGIQNLW